MPRDYKHRANSSRKRATLSPLVGALAGLLIGLFVAFLVYIKSQSEPREQEYVQEVLPPPAATASEDAAIEAHSEEATSSPPPPKPRFDFYTLLPEMEVVIPEEEITESLKQSPPAPAKTPPPPATSASKTEPQPQVAPVPAVTPKPAATAKPAAPAAATGTYYLQVGSFSDGVKAERFKAELGMMGNLSPRPGRSIRDAGRTGQNPPDPEEKRHRQYPDQGPGLGSPRWFPPSFLSCSACEAAFVISGH
jgi:cell division protein FtsN